MYLDPGFGSMIVQVIVAGIAGIGAVLFILRDKIKALFSGRKNISEINKKNEQEQQ